MVPLRVLCVDDNADIGELFVRSFRGRTDVECAGYLPDAERLIEEVESRKADVVVLDMSIPGVDACEVIRRVRRDHPACRVVVYSGYQDARSVQQAIEAGAAGYVCKSETIREVLSLAVSLSGSGARA